MNTTDLRKLNREALKDKLTDLKEELFNLRFQHAINQLENPNKLREVKRDIARVKTILRANDLNIEQGYAELDAAEVPVEDEKPKRGRRVKEEVEKVIAEAEEVVEAAEKKKTTRSRKTKADAEPIAAAEETAETEEAQTEVKETVEPEKAKESTTDQEAQEEETPAPEEEE